jgi:pyridoxamine 5'-phosphate oxidase
MGRGGAHGAVGVNAVHEAVLERAFGLLAQGAADAASPFRHLTLATQGASEPGLRTMVLRRFLPGGPALEFHTDVRSPKLAALQACARVAVLGWDPAARIQLKAAGTVALLDTGEAARIWQVLPPSARSTYAINAGPGTPIASPREAERSLDPEAAQAVFRVIRVRVDQLEWLHLAADQHQRARFTWAPDGVHATWLVP